MKITSRIKKTKKRLKFERINKTRKILADLTTALENSMELEPLSLKAAIVNGDDLLSPMQASSILGVSVKTLANQRSSGGYIQLPFYKIGSRVFYKRSDVVGYRKTREFRNTSQYGTSSNKVEAK